ncbi:MAG: ImmA/IrrE family metallo-endopeptidase [Deltaproteobacteria bacterium]|nr:ImmA/IrrE family metallo-endopeptidase [Deltaproteobacteria bacterium]
MKDSIGRRIKEERTRQNFTQDELIEKAKLDWERQTLGQVENGEREIKAWELAKISSVLRMDMSAFFPRETATQQQPYVLWRKKPKNPARIEAEFLRLCKDYELVETLNSVNANEFQTLPHRKIDLGTFSYPDAYLLAEQVRNELTLGDFPASSLVKILEEKFGIKFFFNDLEGNGSAASSVSSFGYCTLVSSSEVPWRQHFSIAHELFHLITWDDALLAQVNSEKGLWDCNERLADSFAAGLLVPTETLGREIRALSKNNKLNGAGIVAIARQFGVSLEALLWRMVGLRFLAKNTAEKALADDQLRTLDRNIRAEMATEPVQTESNRFLRLAYIAYENGEISRGRLAKMLDIPISDLSDHLKRHGLAEVSNNEIPLSNP